MYHITRNNLAWLMVLAATLGMIGCAATQSHHQKNVNEAEKRWKNARGGLLLQAAQRQFDAGDLTQASKTLDDAINYDPSNGKLHLLSARISLEQGHLERCFRQLEMASEFDKTLSQVPYYQGVVQQRWQKYELARDYYIKAGALEPDNVAYLLAVAEMDLSLHQQDQALERLLTRVDYFDQNAGLRVAIADIYRMKQDYEKAITFYRQASLLDPENFSTLEELGNTLVINGKYSLAIEVYEQLLVNDQYAHRADLNQALARCYLSIKSYDKARKLYEAMRQANTHDIDAWVGLGNVAMKQKDMIAAMRVASRLQNLAPDRHEGYLMAGLCYHHQNDFDKAAKMFTRATQLMPKASEPAILLGLSLQQSGKLDAASQAYAEALRRQPEDQRARQLLERLAQVTP
jgi:tetratricopeptide (TPR) repeat protein